MYYAVTVRRLCGSCTVVHPLQRHVCAGEAGACHLGYCAHFNYSHICVRVCLYVTDGGQIVGPCEAVELPTARLDTVNVAVCKRLDLERCFCKLYCGVELGRIGAGQWLSSCVSERGAQCRCSALRGHGIHRYVRMCTP